MEFDAYSAQLYRKFIVLCGEFNVAVEMTNQVADQVTSEAQSNERSFKLKGTHARINKKDVIVQIHTLKVLNLINEILLSVMDELRISLDDLGAAAKFGKSSIH